VEIGSIDLFMRGKRFMLLVGDSAGSLRLLYRNGTLKQSVPVGGQVSAMARNSNAMAVATSDGRLTLVDLTKMGNEPSACPADDDDTPGTPVVQLAYDVQVPQLLFAATALGQIRVYNQVTRQGADRRQDDDAV